MIISLIKIKYTIFEFALKTVIYEDKRTALCYGFETSTLSTQKCCCNKIYCVGIIMLFIRGLPLIISFQKTYNYLIKLLTFYSTFKLMDFCYELCVYLLHVTLNYNLVTYIYIICVYLFGPEKQAILFCALNLVF